MRGRRAWKRWLLVAAVALVLILWPRPLGFDVCPPSDPVAKAWVMRKAGPDDRKRLIVISKPEYTLTLYIGRKPAATFPIALGREPEGDKVIRNDGRTPEGEFYICQMSSRPRRAFLGARWMRLSYPSIEDARRGLKADLITRREYREIVSAVRRGRIPPQNTRLGGGVGIHGGCFAIGTEMARNWTLGCVALWDSDVIEVYRRLQVGTPVLILG